MNVLVIYRHFKPDSPPYAMMLSEIAGKLADAGHRITVLCEKPCYKESDFSKSEFDEYDHPGVEVIRLARVPFADKNRIAKMLGQALFAPRALLSCVFLLLRRRKFDLVWTATIPPVIQGLVGRIAAKLHRSRFLYHCQDLYPELAVHMGMIEKSSLLDNLGRSIERKNRRAANPLVTLSDDMADTAADLAKPQSLVIINNFSLTDQITSPPEAHSAGKTRFIFAGNLGRFQQLPSIVEATRLLDEDFSAEVCFMGTGSAEKALRQLSSDDDMITMLPHQELERAVEIIGSYDVGLVSLEPGVYKYAFPSKTMTYWGAGLPIIAIVEPESRLADTCRTEEVGIVVPPGDKIALRDAMSELASNSDLRLAMSRNASRLASDLSRDAILKRWVELINGIGSDLE